MTDQDEHANNTNPCVGLCVTDDSGMCIGCFRTEDERAMWYQETNEWRETALVQLKEREDNV